MTHDRTTGWQRRLFWCISLLLLGLGMGYSTIAESHAAPSLKPKTAPKSTSPATSSSSVPPRASTKDTAPRATPPDTPPSRRRPRSRPPARRSKAAADEKSPLWNRDLGLGGYAGSWGNMPVLGLRGAIPLSPYLAMQLSLSLFFATQREPLLSYTGVSLGLLVRLPTLLPAVRNYAVTRIDFWPLWNILNTNPEITKISDKPTLGISILLGMELFLVNSLAFVVETGFSSGMIIGFAPIQTQFEAFGFVIQSGLQMYF